MSRATDARRLRYATPPGRYYAEHNYSGPSEPGTGTFVLNVMVVGFVFRAASPRPHVGGTTRFMGADGERTGGAAFGPGRE